MSEIDKLIQALDRAVQTREASFFTGHTNFTQEQAIKMVQDAKEAIRSYVAALEEVRR